MKRDMGLIRAILIDLESDGNLQGISTDEDLLRYHIRLAIEADLLRGNVAEYAGGYQVLLNDLPITNKGHDFLDAIREDSVWKKVLARITGITGSVGVELLVELAKEEIRKRLGLGTAP